MNGAMVLWSGEVSIEYGYYRVGEPSREITLGGEPWSMVSGSAGVYIGTLSPNVLQVRLSALLETGPVPPGVEVARFKTGEDEGVETGADITAWDGQDARPPASDVLGPGLWDLWIERRLEAAEADEGIEEDEDVFAEDPDEVHVLHAHPADATARAWAATAGPSEATSTGGTVPAPSGPPTWTGSGDEPPPIIYTQFVKAKAGLYFVVWDEDELKSALAVTNLDDALVDDSTPLQLPGGLAFRHRPQAEWTVGAAHGGPYFTTIKRVERIQVPLTGTGEVRILDANLRPVRRVPDPAAMRPCTVRMLKAVRDYRLWVDEPMDDVTAARMGAYDWEIHFAEWAPRG